MGFCVETEQGKDGEEEKSGIDTKEGRGSFVGHLGMKVGGVWVPRLNCSLV